jgi:hypothetical protein
MEEQTNKAQDPQPAPTREEICWSAIHAVLDELKRAKPNDRSEKDRIYAITITDLEKVLAYFQVNALY